VNSPVFLPACAGSERTRRRRRSTMSLGPRLTRVTIFTPGVLGTQVTSRIQIYP